jgi:hypothetical protein
MRKNKCTGCKCRFPADQLISLPAGSTNKFHTYTCAAEYGKAKSDKIREKAIKAKAKKEKAKHTKAKKELNDNDKRYQLKKTQELFNKYIRLRDHNNPCISCGRQHSGQYHAGHYRTVGANPELRFDERNCHKQCAPCNNHLSGNIVNYRSRLLQLYGIDFVEAVEGFHEPKKYTIEDLKELQVLYKHKIKELENAIN